MSGVSDAGTTERRNQTGSKRSIPVTAPRVVSDLIAGSNVAINAETTEVDGAVIRIDSHIDGKSIGYDTKGPFD